MSVIRTFVANPTWNFTWNHFKCRGLWDSQDVDSLPSLLLIAFTRETLNSSHLTKIHPVRCSGEFASPSTALGYLLIKLLGAAFVWWLGLGSYAWNHSAMRAKLRNWTSSDCALKFTKIPRSLEKHTSNIYTVSYITLPNRLTFTKGLQIHRLQTFTHVAVLAPLWLSLPPTLIGHRLDSNFFLENDPP